MEDNTNYEPRYWRSDLEKIQQACAALPNGMPRREWARTINACFADSLAAHSEKEGRCRAGYLLTAIEAMVRQSVPITWADVRDLYLFAVPQLLDLYQDCEGRQLLGARLQQMANLCMKAAKVVMGGGQ